MQRRRRVPGRVKLEGCPKSVGGIVDVLAQERHLVAADIMSMPDKWEYPWFAAWDLAFHCVTLSLIDPEFAKGQLELLCRVWLMNPNGERRAGSAASRAQRVRIGSQARRSRKVR